MGYVVLPQALRIAVPPLINQTLLLFKNTSLAMAIGVGELTYRTREVDSYTFKTFEAFAVATAICMSPSPSASWRWAAGAATASSSRRMR